MAGERGFSLPGGDAVPTSERRAGATKRGSWRRRARKLQAVALGSAAVATVYGLGWAATRPEAIERAEVGSSQRPAHPRLTPPARPGHYRDGTYRGQAQNAFGSVEVAVRIEQGRIASVAITGWSMYYSQDFVAGLPAQVVAHQSADVDVVSAATASWQDFAVAVQRALASAARRS
jgi:uncharacterized protein with FMN-binding domain